MNSIISTNKPIVLIGCFKPDQIYSMEVYLQAIEKEMGSQNISYLTIRPFAPNLIYKLPNSLKKIYRYFSIYFLLPLQLLAIKHKFLHFHIIDHTYSFLALILKNSCTITCHDLYSFHTTEKRTFIGKIDKELFKWSVKRIFNAKKVISVSKYTGIDLEKTINLPSSKIIVSHEGINQNIIYTQNIPSDMNTNTFKIIHVGSNVPRKNIELIFEILHTLKLQNLNIQFIKVGSPFNEDQNKLIDKFEIRNIIIHKGFLSDKELSEYYSASDLLIFPSTFEGFGFPIIEAMHCKCAVIALNGTSITELIKETGVGIDENNASKFINVIKYFIKNPKLLQIQKEKSEQYSRRFHWKYHVNEIVKAGYRN